jgi:hypothetical protein
MLASTTLSCPVMFLLLLWILLQLHVRNASDKLDSLPDIYMLLPSSSCTYSRCSWRPAAAFRVDADRAMLPPPQTSCGVGRRPPATSQQQCSCWLTMSA